MVVKKRPKVVLILAMLTLFVGVSSICRGWAGMYGWGQISGAQAKIFGVLDIVFSLALFIVYLRGK
jgi:uncharacterized membrane protein HdeD (DUF308 family)